MLPIKVKIPLITKCIIILTKCGELCKIIVKQENIVNRCKYCYKSNYRLKYVIKRSIWYLRVSVLLPGLINIIEIQERACWVLF